MEQDRTRHDADSHRFPQGTIHMTFSKMIREEASNMKCYLIATKTWLSFKLIITGVSFFYGGIYTSYQSYGAYLELAGVAMVLIGVWRIPFVKDFFKEVW